MYNYCCYIGGYGGYFITIPTHEQRKILDDNEEPYLLKNIKEHSYIIFTPPFLSNPVLSDLSCHILS